MPTDDIAEAMAKLSVADEHLVLGMTEYHAQGWTWNDFVDRLRDLAGDNEIVLEGMAA